MKNKTLPLLFAFALAPSTALAEMSPDISGALASGFVNSVLSDQNPGSAFGVMKWSLIKVDAAFIYGSPEELEMINQEIRPVVEDAFEEIASSTGVRYNLTDETDQHRDIRLFISVGDPSELFHTAKLLEEALGISDYANTIKTSLNSGGSACAIFHSWSASSSLTQVVISVDTETRTQKCINMMLMRSVGFLNPLEQTIDSVTTSNPEITDFTDTDRLLMQLLYSPEVKRGSIPKLGPVKFLLSELLAGN